MTDTSRRAALRKPLSRRLLAAAAPFALLATALLAPAWRTAAAPDDAPDPPLPVIAPAASNWMPKFPFPYDANRKDVTDADVTAEREMCQWFKADYRELIRQIDRLGFNLDEANNNWTVGQVQAQADAVAANIDGSEDFLAPRAQALTQSKDFANDTHFNIYEGEAFYRLWTHLSNVGVGIKAHNTSWVFGPSVERVKHWGSQIHRSHVCD
jgi:hypothetical protein